ncbi:MAG TPA: 50S ribosomal protein L24e [Candidatus Altiarchaeales archaeon]|nr:MAG: 50S ribosomal protein L24e [Candidatus Altiarchaeales archaeon]HDN83745.1 50S ribosomal protein L24e [Candidatus Altiarchaeales archaeon]
MECSFCGAEIPKGTGKMFVTKRGVVYYFCSGKCEKNMLKLKRNPRKVKWTAAYRKEKEARLKLIEKDKAKVKEEEKKEKVKEAKEEREKKDKKGKEESKKTEKK